MPNPTDSKVQPHHDAEELLPWYATGQLEGDDLTLVQEHLSSCAHCRRQLSFERRMIDEFAELTPEIDHGWARLRGRLEPARVPTHRESWSDRIGREAAAVWRTFTRPAVAAIATVQLAFVGAAAVLLYSLSQPSYQALGSAPPPQSANVIAMFSADTTQSELNRLLRANGAMLVGGPTPTDAYLLRVPASTRTTVLARLHADRHVVLAQPIDGPRS